MKQFVLKQGMIGMGSWRVTFEVISLNRFAPFLPHMGLNLTSTQVEAIQQGARYFIEQYEGQGTDNEAQGEHLFQTTFALITQTAGAETAESFYKWGDDYVSHAHDPFEDGGELIWQILLERLAELRGTHYELAPITLPLSKQEVVVEAIKNHLGDYGQLRQQIEEAEAQPKSAWDKRIYQNYEELSSPMDWVLNTVGFHKTRQAWAEIKTILTDEEMRTLLKWGKIQAEKMKIPSELVQAPR